MASTTLTPPEVKDVPKLIERKATFQTGVQLLVCALSKGTSETSTALLPIVLRCFTLLKSRYTNPGFWKSGQQLAQACKHVSLPSAAAQKIRQFEEECAAVLNGDQENTNSSASSAARQESLLDILLNPVQEPSSHYDDAGPIVDDPERWRRAQVSGTVAAATAGGGGDGAPAAEAQGEAADGAGANDAQQHPRHQLQQQILEGIQAVFSGMQSANGGTEALERELEGVLSSLAGSSQRRAVPPASRKVVANLPVIDVTAEKLRELGPGIVCSVCCEDAVVGDQLLVLPCKHMYHPDCVKSWLVQNNSCPVCRHQLPTDDPHYEAQKEKEAEEEEERRGAANAVTHNEFMYI